MSLGNQMLAAINKNCKNIQNKDLMIRREFYTPISKNNEDEHPLYINSNQLFF